MKRPVRIKMQGLAWMLGWGEVARQWRIFCPVCGHDMFHSPLAAPNGEVLGNLASSMADAFREAERMAFHHVPSGASCGDWGRP